MGKMEAAEGPADIKELLAVASQPSKEETAAYEKSLQQIRKRQTVLRQEIIKLYVSGRREIPNDETLDVEVGLAMGELKEIPLTRLGDCFQEAKIQAGGFMPSNGLIGKVWRELNRNPEADAQAAIRSRNNESLRLAHQAYEHDKPEKEFFDEYFAKARRDLR